MNKEAEKFYKSMLESVEHRAGERYLQTLDDFLKEIESDNQNS